MGFYIGNNKMGGKAEIEVCSLADRDTLIKDITVSKYKIVSPENMTSANTPSPFVVSDNSHNVDTEAGWCAFDGKSSTGWCTSISENGTGILTIDLGVETTIDTLIIVSQEVNYAPKDFTFSGSNDGSTYEPIYTASNLSSWTALQDRIFEFGRKVTYRYYKLNVTASRNNNTWFELRRVAFALGKEYTNTLEENNAEKLISYNDIYEVIRETTVDVSFSEAETNMLQKTEDIENDDGSTIDGGFLVDSLNDNDLQTLINDLTIAKDIVVSPENLTSNTTPSPYVVTQTSYSNTNTLGWKAFDGNPSTSWDTSISQEVGAVTIDLGAQLEIDSLIMVSKHANYAPSAFTFSGSNNGSQFDTIYSVSGLSAWTVGANRVFDLGKTVSYRYYKVNVTAIRNNNTWIGLNRIAFSKKKYVNSLETQNAKKVVSYNDIYNIIRNMQTTTQ